MLANVLNDPILLGYVVLSATILTTIFYRTCRKKSKHYFKIKSADRALDVVGAISCPKRAFGYLRKVDPFVFEEMVLSAMAKYGYKIKRNRRYTGDGGIDGQVKIDGDWCLIQCKRYSNYINNKHLTEFIDLCERKGCKGLFVHSGRTGKKCLVSISSSVDVKIISGSGLLRLLKKI